MYLKSWDQKSGKCRNLFLFYIQFDKVSACSETKDVRQMSWNRWNDDTLFITCTWHTDIWSLYLVSGLIFLQLHLCLTDPERLELSGGEWRNTTLVLSILSNYYKDTESEEMNVHSSSIPAASFRHLRHTADRRTALSISSLVQYFLGRLNVYCFDSQSCRELH